MKISIVIPLYNEYESLPHLTEAILKVFETLPHTLEIVFIDDGSTDSSYAVITELHKKHREIIKAFRFSHNYGKSAGLSVGIEQATGDIIITMDADLQDDPCAIPEMLAKLEEGWDVVSGWKKKRHDPLEKRLPSKFFNFTVSSLSGVKLHDFNCGFKAYRAYAAKSLEIYGERHRFLPALAHWEGYKVTEIPVPHHARKFSKSKFGIGRYTNGALDLITLLFLRKYLSKPLHFFGLLGILLMAAGTIVLGYFGVQWIITQHMHIRPLTLLSMGAVIMGIQFISIGLVCEMIINVTKHRNYSIRDTLE